MTDPFMPKEREPMLLLDRSGSMHFRASATDTTPRYQVVHEALALLVARLKEQDSQSEHEASGGGLRAFTFGGDEPGDLGDLRPDNLAVAWAQIKWHGGTYIVPGYHAARKAYQKEFGHRPGEERPDLLLLVITDGEADDSDAFAGELARASGDVYVTIALLGYGAEHDAALKSYETIARSNHHVSVVSLESCTDPETMVAALLGMVE